MKNLSEKITELRKARNMTQEDLAGELHVSRQAVSKWETGRSLPSVDLLRAIAAALGVPVSELLTPIDADELAYRNLEELSKVRKWNKFLLIGMIAAVVFAIAGLTLGLVFGLNPRFVNPEADRYFVGLFYDLTDDLSASRDGEIVTVASISAEKSPCVVYTKIKDENGKETYRYKVRGIKPAMTSVGNYATFHGTLYYDRSKMSDKKFQLYEIFQSADGVMRLNYPKQSVPDGQAPAYRRDDGSSESNDSIRSIKIDTQSVLPIRGAVLTELDEDFAAIKKTDIFDDLSRDKGLIYALDPRACYVVFSITKPQISNPAEVYTETKFFATGDLEHVYWLPILDENGFYRFDKETGYLTFDLPKYS